MKEKTGLVIITVLLTISFMSIEIGYASKKNNDPWNSLQKHSNSVVKGYVTDVESFWINTTRSELIHSKVTLLIDNVIKGTFTTKEMQAIVQGGTIGEQTHLVEVNPFGPLTVQLGDHVTIYIEKTINQAVPIILAIQHHSKQSPIMTRSTPTSIYEEYGFGFEYNTYIWNEYYLPPDYYVYDNCDDVSGEEYDVYDSADEWGDVSSSDFYLQYCGVRSWPIQSNDGINMVYWDDLPPPIGAYCYPYAVGGKIVGFDIRLNSDYPGPLDWSSARIRDITTHEFGHVLRLNDLDVVPDQGQTMYHETHSGADSLDFGDMSGFTYLYPNDDVPSVTILDPDPDDSIDSSVYVRVSVSCPDSISNVKVCLANAGESQFSRWHTLYLNGGYYSRTISLPVWFDSGSGYVSVRAETVNGIFGFSWVPVTYN